MNKTATDNLQRIIKTIRDVTENAIDRTGATPEQAVDLRLAVDEMFVAMGENVADLNNSQKRERLRVANVRFQEVSQTFARLYQPKSSS